MKPSLSNLYHLIANNYLDLALQELHLILASELQYQDLLKQQLILSAEYQELMTLKRSGQVQFANYQIRRNQIVERFLSITQEIEKNITIGLPPNIQSSGKPEIIQNHSGNGHNIIGDVIIKK